MSLVGGAATRRCPVDEFPFCESCQAGGDLVETASHREIVGTIPDNAEAIHPLVIIGLQNISGTP